MSPYSSVLRSRIWGGIPVTLAGMAVFAYLLYRALDAWLYERERDEDLARFTVAAWALPVLTSIGFAVIAFTQLHEFCKLCMGTYLSSFVGFGAAIAAIVAKPAPVGPVEGEDAAEALPEPPIATGGHFARFSEGVLFVALPVSLYVLMAPDFSNYLGQCGTLPKPDDKYGVMIPVGPQTGKPAVEVLDPLCPSCAGMERRLEASGLADDLARKAVLFPLDSACNWMVTSALHPGACTVSEAVLCAGEKADGVLAWAYEHGEEVRTAEAATPGSAASMVTAAFPEVASCLGSAEVKQRLNRSLRWIVANRLPVLTPQLYVDDVKLCDDDTDLGLDWSLSRLLARTEGGDK
jgi:hypothetical protein